MATKSEAIEIDGVRVTSPDKVLYSASGITKRQIIDYYRAIAPAILPHIGDRPISLVRCPDGAESAENPCFYQRHPGKRAIPHIDELKVPGIEENFLVIKDAAGLIAAVQMGTLEMHAWGSCIDDPAAPNRLVFDLDPGEGLTFADTVAGAHQVRDVLAGMGLTSFCKTTGGKGLHIVLPMDRTVTWPQAKAWARKVGEDMTARWPDRYLIRNFIAERVGKIFIDYLRNDWASTAVSPYSTRARAGAPVSVPLSWDEVTPALDPKAFTYATVPARFAKVGDPWSGIGDVKQALPV